VRCERCNALDLRRRIRESRYARHILVSSCLIITIIAIGIGGYVLIEDLNFTQAFYQTIITISTVGFREVKTMSTAGMYFTIFIIVTGVSSVLFFLTGLFEFVLSEALGDVWGRRRMMSNISKLENHYILCGYGRVGRSVAEELSDHGRRFVVIELDREAYDDCIRDGYYAINGSATDNEQLLNAGIKRAVGLVSALRSDADNLFVVLTARTLNSNLILVARADQLESEQKLEMVGADRVISPHKIAGKRMANLLVRPGACEFLDVAMASNLPEYFLSEMKVGKSSRMVNQTIGQSRLRERTGVSILAVRKVSDKAFNPNPGPETLIEEEDVLVLIGTPEQMALMESENV
jgi:voltage-gated potassium channel